MKPKKLIRREITKQLKEGEWETITDQDELNKLYALKIREELEEIQASEHKDIFEFVDLMQVAHSFALQNGFTVMEICNAIDKKSSDKGLFGRLALNNINPSNPSNKLYFENFSSSNEVKNEQELANTRMLAAAPDLFEAVEQLLSRIVVSDTWDQKAVWVAKAALQKAKGQVEEQSQAK
jgi:predicted house-cleaning noncanonical NTP pyrophosphatase (MazG superfamily)